MVIWGGKRIFCPGRREPLVQSIPPARELIPPTAGTVVPVLNQETERKIHYVQGDGRGRGAGGGTRMVKQVKTTEKNLLRERWTKPTALELAKILGAADKFVAPAED